MAHHKSAIKSIRKNAKVTDRNRQTRTEYRNAAKNVLAFVAKGDVKGAADAFKNAQKTYMAAVSKGVIKKETASRTVSRLNAQVKKLAKAA